MSNLADLYRRMSKKIDARRTIQLSPEDLDLFVLTGAYETFVMAVAADAREKALERQRERSDGQDG